jgi:hypothetical protein
MGDTYSYSYSFPPEGFLLGRVSGNVELRQQTIDSRLLHANSLTITDEFS